MADPRKLGDRPPRRSYTQARRFRIKLTAPCGTERLFIRDDWFVHAYAGYAIGVTQGEGRLMLGEFDADIERYLQDLAIFFAEQEIAGPFAVTFALRALNDSDEMKFFFPRGATVRTLRPRLVDAVDDPDLVADLKRRVRQASVYG